MPRVQVKTTLTLDKTIERIEKMDAGVTQEFLSKYGKLGLEMLRIYTPKRTGLTANSWGYKISMRENNVSLSFTNSNIQNGVCIAMVIEYGHATMHGAWVEGQPYIEEALLPVFDEMLKELRKNRRGGKKHGRRTSS